MNDELMLLGTSRRELSIRERVHRLAEFYRHLFTDIIVNICLWALNLTMLWGSPAQAKQYAYWAL